jgi:hypothetical protein
VILFDHNIPRDQVEQLRRWRIRGRQIGYEVGRPEWQDQEEVLRELHRAKRVTLFTRDLGFFRSRFLHPEICVVVVAGAVMETASDIRRLLRHPHFRTTAARKGCVIKLSRAGIAVQRAGSTRQQRLAWD